MAIRFAGSAAAVVLGAVTFLGAQSPAAAAGYTAVYAFGDSLSDNGNLLAGTGGILPQPVDYYQGRFSNGPVAVEYLAQGLGVALHDLAYGGAGTGALNGNMVAVGAPTALQNTGVLSQVNFFQASLGSASADSHALYFLWAGASDFQYEGYTAATAQAAILNLGTAVQTLYSLGARNFLVPGLADMGLTPQGLNSGASAQLQQLSLGFNLGLTGVLGQLNSLPGIDIRYFDVLGAQHALIGNSTDDITNVTDACFTGYVGVPGTHCSDPSAHMYWDLLNPSAATHQILGRQMLAAVPEPDAMLMMAIGSLALLGAARRRTV